MTTFGEIVEPVSRTAWEDWDDGIPDYNTAQLQWKLESKTPEEIDIFMIFEGKYLTDCVQMQTHNNLHTINLVPEVNMRLFKSKTSNRYICTLRDYNLVLSSEIVELLKPYLLVSKDVIAVQTKPLPEYQATELSHQDCVIRMVSTDQCPLKSLEIAFPKLEQPNIVSGVSAGVVCLRDHLNLSGAVIVCYMEHPEEYKIEELEKLLLKLNINQISTSRPSTVLNSNLYI